MKGFGILFTAAFAAMLSTTAHADDTFLEGDVRLACEAILCLSAGATGYPAECRPSIRKYFSIVRSKPHKTLTARLNFLRLCPTVDEEHVQQAKRGSDAMHRQRIKECSESCAKRDEYGYEIDADGGYMCRHTCMSNW